MNGPEESAEQHIKNIRRATRKRYSTEEKIRIVLSGLRGEQPCAQTLPSVKRANPLMRGVTPKKKAGLRSWRFENNLELRRR